MVIKYKIFFKKKTNDPIKLKKLVGDKTTRGRVLVCYLRNNNGSAERKEVTLPGDVRLPGSRRDMCVIGGHEAATRVPDRDSIGICIPYQRGVLSFRDYS